MPEHGTASPSVGIFAEFAGAVVACLPRDLDPAAMQRWVETAGRQDLRALLQRAFRTPWARTIKTLTVTCHGNATATQLVQQGEYDWFNNWITDERFPIQPHQPATYVLELFQFDHDPTWEEVLAERGCRGLDEPTYEQGFYVGIQHPEEQREYRIAITHEPVQGPGGGPDVLVLFGGADYRELRLFYTGYGWDRDCVFVGVRKVASP